MGLRRLWLWGLVLGGCLLGFTGVGMAEALVAVPSLRARVTDQISLLSSSQQAALTAQLAAVEQRLGSQVAILVVASTAPESIEQYSMRVVESWRLGRGRAAAQAHTGQDGAAAIDDGVLIVVARDDRRMRLEVGYGLEGAIPDAVAKRIVSDVMAPAFRAGDYAGGLGAAVDALAQRMAGESLPPPKPATRQTESPLLVLVVVGVVVSMLISGVLGRVLGGALGGIFAGLATLGSGSTWGWALGIGIGVWAWVLMTGGAGSARSLRRMGRHTWGPGSWGGGGSGGFGGGGGGFGGGGASGGW